MHEKRDKNYSDWSESNCVLVMNLSIKLRMSIIIALQFIVMSQVNQIVQEKLTLLTGRKSSEFHRQEHLTQIKWPCFLFVYEYNIFCKKSSKTCDGDDKIKLNNFIEKNRRRLYACLQLYTYIRQTTATKLVMGSLMWRNAFLYTMSETINPKGDPH